MAQMRGLLGAIADAARVAVNALPPRLLCRLAFPDLNQGDALLRVAEGSGPGGWRGPWGHSQAECRDVRIPRHRERRFQTIVSAQSTRS